MGTKLRRNERLCALAPQAHRARGARSRGALRVAERGRHQIMRPPATPEGAGARPALVRQRRIRRFLLESGSKEADAAVTSGACARATRTPPPALRRT